MAAEVDASLPKTEANKMAGQTRRKTKPSLLDITLNKSDLHSTDCQKCEKKMSTCFCIECGDVYLCSDCSKMTHNTKSRKKHRVKELPLVPEGALVNGIMESQLIDFDNAVEDDNFVANNLVEDISRVAPDQDSFLLVDGYENLQVANKIKRLLVKFDQK